jgi:hypothetical protein
MGVPVGQLHKELADKSNATAMLGSARLPSGSHACFKQ